MSAPKPAAPKLTPAQRLCAFCGGPAEGNYAVHRDGFCEGPEVDLCDAHGGSKYPTLAAIWERIAQRKAAGASFTDQGEPVSDAGRAAIAGRSR